MLVSCVVDHVLDAHVVVAHAHAYAHLHAHVHVVCDVSHA